MNKHILKIIILIIGIFSCKSSDVVSTRLEVAKQYYNILNTSNHREIGNLLIDSLITKEGNYEQVFRKSEYIEWLQWDYAFEPTYKILEIRQEDDMVVAKVSKTDKRILFLNEAPIVTRQVLRFKDNKIVALETTDYLEFNEALFLKNRTELLKYIEANHPELNGFIHNQTKAGGLDYLKAMDLYDEVKKI